MSYGLPSRASYQLVYPPYPVSSQDIATLLTSVGTSAPSYESSLAEPITPDRYPLTTSVTDPSIMYPISISSHSHPLPSAYPPPDLSYGPSDESPMYSAPDSPFSPDFIQSFQPAGAPLAYRDRSASAPSFTQSWIPLPKTPLPEQSSISASWTMEEAVSAASTSIPCDVESFVNLGIPSSSAFSHEPAPNPSTSPLRLAILGMDTAQRNELRKLLRAPETDQDLLQSPFVDRLEECLELYWQRFDPLLPIVHRSVFLTRNVSPLLLVSMAIMGAQYGNWDALNFAITAHQATKASLAAVSVHWISWYKLISSSVIPRVRVLLLPKCKLPC
jgi:hypothetical protein